jgi:hypothetical protein
MTAKERLKKQKERKRTNSISETTHPTTNETIE